MITLIVKKQRVVGEAEGDRNRSGQSNRKNNERIEIMTLTNSEETKKDQIQKFQKFKSN